MNSTKRGQYNLSGGADGKDRAAHPKRYIAVMSKPPEMNKAEQWLSREDERCRTGRLERLQWLATELPPGEYLTFPGGLMAKFLFEETRYCFAYGQYLAVIVLGVAFIERT